MSVLTKVFVSLLVILVIVYTSGNIVFLNKIEEYSKTTKKAQEDAGREKIARQAAEQQLAAAVGETTLAAYEADARAKDYQVALTASVETQKKLEVAVASANLEIEKYKTLAANADTASQGALATIAAQQKIINDSAVVVTAAQKENAENQTRLAKLVQDVDGLQAARRHDKETIVADEQKLDDLTKGKAGVAGSQSGGMEAILNLRGVVKAKRNYNGTEYATISIGAAQNVTKGMQFKVTDGSNFLGYLKIDSVETDESVGHLDGPNLTMIRPGSQVRTQW